MYKTIEEQLYGQGTFNPYDKVVLEMGITGNDIEFKTTVGQFRFKADKVKERGWILLYGSKNTINEHKVIETLEGQEFDDMEELTDNIYSVITQTWGL